MLTPKTTNSMPRQSWIESETAWITNEHKVFQKNALRIGIPLILCCIASVWMMWSEHISVSINSCSLLGIVGPSIIGLYGILFYLFTKNKEVKTMIIYGIIGLGLTLVLGLLYIFI
jgi:hypothetical protein